MTTARKAFTPADFKLDDKGAVTVAFAQLNVVDRDGDVTVPGAFPAKSVPMSAYGHTSWDGALPVGKGTIREEGEWAIFDGNFLMGTEQGRNAYETVKEMAELQEWSYGYDPTEHSYGQQDGRSVRFLKRLDVYEISPVLLGAGVGTHTRGIKSGTPGLETPYAEHASWIREAVKAFVDRSDDRAEWRAKEGRELSVANREDLIALATALGGFDPLVKELTDLIDATDPTKAGRLHQTEVDILLAQARANGVVI